MHNLNSVNGRIAFAYIGKPGWHSLGRRMADAAKTNLDLALATAQLANWGIMLESVYLTDGRIVPGRKAVVRAIDRNILGTVGDRYRIVQNEAAFAVIRPLLQSGAATIECAGALGNGERTWLLCKLAEDFSVIPGDTIRAYFLVITSHDGTMTTCAFPTPIRVVCQNTLNAAIGRKGRGTTFTIRHTESAARMLDDARALMAQLGDAYRETALAFGKMAAVPMTATESADYFADILPSREVNDTATAPAPADVTLDSLLNRPFVSQDDDADARVVTVGKMTRDRAADGRAIMLDLMTRGAGAALAGSTLWGAYNAATEYADHVQVARQDGTLRKGGYESALFGTGADFKRLALDAAMARL